MRPSLLVVVTLAALTVTTAGCKKGYHEEGEKASEALGHAREAVDDAATTAKVKSKLAADPNVAAYTIDVDTHDGVVTLNGHVDSEAAKAAAEKVARGTEGVKDVVVTLVIDSAAATPTP
jgi:hyperosmotically inducible protein